MDEEEEDVPTCPLCLEELDATDRAVRACHCGYQVCLLCLNYIREQNNPRCPACRTPYEEQNFTIEAVNPEQAAKEAKERKTAKKERERREKMKEIEKERARAMVLSQQKAKNNLKHARIMQRNLVYVIGLSLTLAREEVIRRVDMFGKYGRMMRILVNRSHPFNADAPGGPSISAYVQYVRDADALSAVRAMNNAVFDGREIRCAIATTKYCDALLRNAHAADPSGTFHCGNTQCMYYHSTTHSETVLTKEEVLARQLGPPPPAHLFQPPSGRRPHFLPNPRASNLPTPPSVASMGRPIPSRPQINPGVLPNPPSSAPVIHPPSGPLGSSSFAVGTPSDQQNYNPSPPPSSPTLSSGIASRTTSFHRSPPLSPEIRRQTTNRLSTSPNISDPAGSVPAAGAASSSSATSTNSSAAWASTQPGHPITRTPTRRSPTPSDDPGRPRLGVMRRARADAPPGFETTTPTRPQVSMPLRPPGFEAPVSTTASNEPENLLRPKDRDAPVSESPKSSNLSNGTSLPANVNSRGDNGEGSSAISPPPGFGPEPPNRPNIKEESTKETAAAWSQEASSDQVFSGNERRPTSAIGQVGARNSTTPASTPTTSESPAELAKVLASIGGSLGVSSEFRTLQQGAVQPADSTGKRQANTPSAATPQKQGKPPTGQLGSLFGGIPHSQSTTALPIGSNFTSNATSPGPSNPNRSLDGMSPSTMRGTQAAIPSDYIRAHVRPGMRRNISRFGFARDVAENSLKSNPVNQTGTLHDPLGNTNNLDEHSSSISNTKEPVSNTGALNLNGSPGPRTHPTASRQPRSRFVFADQGASPIQDDPGIEENVEIRLGPTPNGVLGQGPTGTGISFGDAFGESFANMSTEEKLASIFTSAKWAPDSLPPMPQFNSQVDDVMQHNTGIGSNVLQRDPNEARGSRESTNAQLAQLATSSGGQLSFVNEARTRGIAVQPPPPGFRGATPGFSPETTAADTMSASTGVATKVVSGVPLPKSSKPEVLTEHSEDIAGSGGESSEEAEKSRVQRKRDRRERRGKQAKENNERKSTKGSGIADVGFAKNTEANSTEPHNGEKSESCVSHVHEWKQSKGKTVSAVKDKSDDPHPVVESTVVSGLDKTSEIVRSNKRAKEDKFKLRGERDDVARGSENQQDLPSSTNVPGDADNSEENTRHTALPRIVDSSGRHEEDNGEVNKFMSVSELEREVEAARVREAQLQDKLLEITRRLRSYDNVRT